MSERLKGTSSARVIYVLSLVSRLFFIFVVLQWSVFCNDVESKTERIEWELDPARQLLRDSLALAVLRLDERIEHALGYLVRLRSAVAKIDKELCPGEQLSSDLESIMDQLKEVSSRVQS